MKLLSVSLATKYLNSATFGGLIAVFMFQISPNSLPTLQSELLLSHMTCTFPDRSAISEVDSLMFWSHFLYVTNTFSTSGDRGYPIFSLHLHTAVRLSSFLLLVLLGLLLLFLLLCLFSQFYYNKKLCYNELTELLSNSYLSHFRRSVEFTTRKTGILKHLFLSFHRPIFHEWKMTVL